MNVWKSRFVGALIALFVLVLGGAALAGPATDAVKAKQATLFELIRKGGADNDKKVTALCDEMLDYDAFAQGSLGAEWASRSDAEKAQFSDLLKQLVRRNYEQNLKKLLDYDVQYTKEAAEDGATVVAAKATSKTNAREEPFDFTLKLQQKGGAWKIVDIAPEGVSLVKSYKSQFTKIIKEEGFPGLIKKMKERLAKP